MGRTIIRGETVDEKFASADKALSQLERRIEARSIVAPLTPIVVMGYCKEDDEGVIFKGVFPISGFITKVSFFIERLENEELLKKDALKFIINAYQPSGDYQIKEISSKRLSAAVQSNFKVLSDSLLTISVSTKVFGVYYGFVLEPEVPVRKKIDLDLLEE